MRFAICNETFKGWSWDATCRFVAEAGYEGIEIAPFTLADDVRSLNATARQRIRTVAASAGLSVIGLHWLLVAPTGLSLTDADDAVRGQTARYLVDLVELCADLGGGVMVLGSPKQRRIPEGDTREVAQDRFLAGVRPALDAALARGVRLCLEPLPPPEADFLLNLREAAELLDRLDHPAAATILDVKSASADEAPIPELIARHIGRIAHVHANDANRRGPGFGQTDFDAIMPALRDAGYDGWVSVEVFDYTPDPRTIATTGLATLKRPLSR